MKFSRYASAIASAALLAATVASPIQGETGLAPPDEKREEENTRDPVLNKYFHEPGGDDQLGHYDVRYFHGIVSYEERTDTQRHMIRAYLKFFNENGLDTWIAHGTLLGWWWNGKRLPWDWDLDTQVSGATLDYLGQHFNQSIHHYVSEDGETKRDFLLDVNPWIWERERGDGMNVIDARWIDIRNGLFIDITGLSETHPDTNPAVWSCKNYHRYRTSDLYPMRESIFEGVPAKIPYAYDKILIEEYQEKALVLTEYEGHDWDPSKKEWIKTQAQIEKEAKEEEERAKKKAEEEAKKTE
ncbi:mannosylphosphate transferase [Clohesyomyces aquaticus]|uniref:Mannosylphosphate transferase n=1 Tax=Clohesyomyces aquaticus TaxID=1231657 RepID=A0A1Y1YU69_9PLEO|nr:mannosylphosphate transferase [Clohesyomyces aquaticus]